MTAARKLQPVPDFSENEYQRAIIDALNARPGLRAWRQQTGKVKVRGGWMQLSPNGAGDIVGTASPDGLHFEVEVKAFRHRVEDAQDPWAEATIACGAVYLRAVPVRGDTLATAVRRVVEDLEGAIAEARSRRACSAAEVRVAESLARGGGGR